MVLHLCLCVCLSLNLSGGVLVLGWGRIPLNLLYDSFLLSGLLFSFADMSTLSRTSDLYGSNF